MDESATVAQGQTEWRRENSISEQTGSNKNRWNGEVHDIEIVKKEEKVISGWNANLSINKIFNKKAEQEIKKIG